AEGNFTHCPDIASRSTLACAQLGAQCTPAGCRYACTGAEASGCRGEVALPCAAEPTPLPPGWRAQDCSLTAGTCVNGACTSTARTPQCASRVPPCLETMRLRCVDGRVHVLDCASIGASGCGANGCEP